MLKWSKVNEREVFTDLNLGQITNSGDHARPFMVAGDTFVSFDF